MKSLKNTPDGSTGNLLKKFLKKKKEQQDAEEEMEKITNDLKNIIESVIEKFNNNKEIPFSVSFNIEMPKFNNMARITIKITGVFDEHGYKENPSLEEMYLVEDALEKTFNANPDFFGLINIRTEINSGF